MKLNEIKEILKLIDEAKLQEVEIEQEDVKIKIKRTPDQKVIQNQQPVAYQAPVVYQQPATPTPSPTTPTPVAAAPKVVTQAESDVNLVTIKSPMTGTFYSSSSPENPPFVTPGKEIKEGDTLCIVEAMKLFNEIESDESGTIEKVLVTDGQPVELDQPLFLLRP